ncbi:MAG: endonuclease NucS [Actinomycetaceae bacterium]|nr:endonuclease NucS [Actinomycetaceae bacterium]
MRLVVAKCAVDYSGRLDAHLPMAVRLLMVKADGSVLVHSDGGSYKPLNWMAAPCRTTLLEVSEDDARAGITEIWQVQATKDDGKLIIRIGEVFHDIDHAFGVDPGLTKDGVEAHLQELLAAQVPDILGTGWKLLRREYPTPIGPVDLVVFDPDGLPWAIEVKRVGGIDGVEQLGRYLELLGREPALKNIRGIFAAQQIRPQAKTLAHDRDIRTLLLDYTTMRGMDDSADKLF